MSAWSLRRLCETMAYVRATDFWWFGMRCENYFPEEYRLKFLLGKHSRVMSTTETAKTRWNGAIHRQSGKVTYSTHLWNGQISSRKLRKMWKISFDATSKRFRIEKTSAGDDVGSATLLYSGRKSDGIFPQEKNIQLRTLKAFCTALEYCICMTVVNKAANHCIHV